MPIALPPPSTSTSTSLSSFFATAAAAAANASTAMNSSDYPSGKSPRRELQGPRPTPLKVRKDSHKIRKPPIVPQQQSQSHLQPPYRPPVIIYTVSPKIIHTNPNEFMQLVQRLTGPNASAVASTSSLVSSSSSFFQDNYTSGAISPAARFASLEKIKSPEGKKMLPEGGDVQILQGVDISADIDRITGLFPGILSPGPNSLPPIPPNFFSPPSDPNPLSFFHDLSPALHSNKNNFIEGSFTPGSFMPGSFMPGSFMPSPSNNFFSPNISYSPSPSVDLFNNFFDL